MRSVFLLEEWKKGRRAVSIFVLMIAAIAGFLCIAYAVTILANKPPEDFPVETDIIIDEGLTLREITDVLREKHVVRSSLYAYLVLVGNYEDKFVQAGTYRFQSPMTTHEIARSVTEGLDMSPHITVTLPEGFRARDLYSYLPESFKLEAVSLEEYEGYLFPDTYFISQGMDVHDLVAILLATFEKKLAPYAEKISNSGFTLHEVVTLASLIEREAKDAESKRMVSGILQKRLDIGMPLQADATFYYLLGKESSELTESDLSLDSPFNTYLYAGLPPGPIANPGLESIEAVLDPIETDYLYYLTASDGTFYYARTFDDHKWNKERYLR